MVGLVFPLSGLRKFLPYGSTYKNGVRSPSSNEQIVVRVIILPKAEISRIFLNIVEIC